MTGAVVKLGGLAEMHSFFRVLYTKWFYLHSKGFKNNGEKVTCALDELRTLPEELPLYQKQIQRFFELILDIDKAGREPSQQIMRYYHFDQPDRPSDATLFPFRLLTTRFRAGGWRCLCAGAVREFCGGYDQLFFADLRRAQHHCAPLQELRTLLCTDGPCQR